MQASVLDSVAVWVLGVGVVAGVTLVSLLGMALVRRSVALEALEAHNDVAGFIIAIVGVIYAVVLALVVASVWNDYEDVQASATREANALYDIHRLASVLPAKSGDAIQERARSYARLVVEAEWSAMRYGAASTRTADALDELWRATRAADPRTPVEVAAFQELLEQLDRLGDARNDRLLASRTSLPHVLWAVLIGGAIMTVGFTYFFGVRRIASQALMTAVLAITIGLALFLIVALDLPFTGDAAVAPYEMQQVLSALERADWR